MNIILIILIIYYMNIILIICYMNIISIIYYMNIILIIRSKNLSGIFQAPYRFRFMGHLNLIFVVPFSHQAKLITELESLRFPSLRFHVFYTKNVTSPSVRRQREKRVSDEIRRRREWIQRADGLSSVVTVRTRHGLCMRLS